MSEQPNEIHDQIGKLKTDLFRCIGTIESIQSKCRSRPHQSPAHPTAAQGRIDALERGLTAILNECDASHNFGSLVAIRRTAIALLQAGEP